MLRLIVIAFAILAGAGATYSFMNKKIGDLEQQVAQLKRKPVDYGKLEQVNHVTLATSDTKFSCTHRDGGFPTFKGIYTYFWDFEFGYGVDIPNNFVWKIDEQAGNPSVGTITLPSLQQIRPIKVEFDSFREENKGSTRRFIRMYGDVLTAARDITAQAGDERLIIAPTTNLEDIWKKAKDSAQAFLLPLVNEARASAEKAPLTTLEVKFSGEPKTLISEGTGLTDGKCISDS